MEPKTLNSQSLYNSQCPLYRIILQQLVHVSELDLINAMCLLSEQITINLPLILIFSNTLRIIISRPESDPNSLVSLQMFVSFSGWTCKENRKLAANAYARIFDYTEEKSHTPTLKICDNVVTLLSFLSLKRILYRSVIREPCSGERWQNIPAKAKEFNGREPVCFLTATIYRTLTSQLCYSTP